MKQDSVNSGPTNLTIKEYALVGLLLFGLFFGSGNVIFPIKLGQQAGQAFPLATLGFLLTAVGLPMLAVISSTLSQRSSLLDFASAAGKPFGYFFTLALYLTIGPGFAIPRNATVPYEIGIHPFFPTESQLPLFLYSLVFFFLVWYFARKPRQILHVVGRYLTPIFLILVGIILVAVLLNPLHSIAEQPALPPYDHNALGQSVLDGYGTMDALAGLAFAYVIIQNVRALGVQDHKAIARVTGKASLISLLCFVAIYTGMIYLGIAAGSLADSDANGGNILGLICQHYFGPVGNFLLFAIVAVACLKTAVGLVVALSKSFSELFPRFSYKAFMYIFIFTSFLVANFGLDQILSWSVPMLSFLYPITITYILLWLIQAFFPFVEGVFKSTLLFVLIPSLIDLVKALPAGLAKMDWSMRLVGVGKRIFPFSEVGLGWLVPALIGFVLGLIFFNRKPEAIR